MSVQMELHKIIISEMQDSQIIVLKEVDGERNFPIVIGSPEAMAIDRRLKGHPIPRPQTHDLLASVIQQMGGTIEKIEINDLAEHTFFAMIYIRRDGEILQIVRAGVAIADIIGRHIRIIITAEQMNAHEVGENGIAADGIVGGAIVV